MNSSRTSIEFNYEGKHYKLEYTANAIKKMERSGVKFAKLDDMVLSAPEILFRGAFYANHPATDEKTIRKIWGELKSTAEGMEPEYDEDGNEIDAVSFTLARMLKEAITEMSGRTGNLEWKVTG